MNKHQFDYTAFRHAVMELQDGWSQVELAQLCDIGSQVLTRLLNEHPIGIENFMKVCNTLDLDPHQFIRKG